MREGVIGKFEVLAKVSRGGMAEVYRCRLRGIGGFEKTVAVKRIRAERASDPDFVSMFLDEARLAGTLNHPNIVQVFEIGEVGGDPYIAMEYVDGPTFARLVRAARRSDRLHLGHLVKILSDVAAGLHHAHTAVGARGEPLGLVHRDVSPQNILVSREGVPKLLDFGVAKANGRLTETQAGTLKGKLRYMAPEQLSGTVDQRADLFALGVCLFEATTGHSPYGADDLDEIALYHNIASGRCQRPSQLVPGYPRLLEEIVMWALDPDLARRCPSAWELHETLEEVLATGGRFESSTRALRDWVRDLCPPDAADTTPAARPDGAFGRNESDPLQTPLEQLTALPPGRDRRLRRRPRLRRAWLASGALALAALCAVALARRTGVPPVTLAPAGSVAHARPAAPAPPRLPAPQEGPLPLMGAAVPPAASRSTTGHRASPSPSLRRHRAPAAPTLEALEAPAPPAPPALTATLTTRAPTPPLADPSAIYSARPRDPVPAPGLPRVYRPTGATELARALAAVEEETLRAGCSPPFSRGITRSLQEALLRQPAPELYPAAVYYFIVRAASLGRERTATAQELVRVHSSGVVRALNRLPVDGQSRL